MLYPLNSAQLIDYACHHAIEQRRFVHDNNGNHPDADQAPKLGSRTLFDGFSQLVNEEEAAPERTDVGQLGRSVRVFRAFLAKFHPGSFLKAVNEFNFVHCTFSVGRDSGAHIRGFQFFDTNLAPAERVLDGEDLGEVQ